MTKREHKLMFPFTTNKQIMTYKSHKCIEQAYT